MRIKIAYLKEVDSTSAYLIRSYQWIDHGTAVVADVQIQGRGKQGRKWKSDQPSNLYMSILFKDSLSFASVLPHITLFSSLVTVECLKHYIPPSSHKINIRWPNDIMVDNKKIAGILAESAWQGEKLLYTVLGVGFNISMTTHELSEIDQPATALNHCCTLSVDKNEFMHRWLDHFSKSWQGFLSGGVEDRAIQHYLVGTPLGFKLTKTTYINGIELKKKNNPYPIEARR